MLANRLSILILISLLPMSVLAKEPSLPLEFAGINIGDDIRKVRNLYRSNVFKEDISGSYVNSPRYGSNYLFECGRQELWINYKGGILNVNSSNYTVYSYKYKKGYNKDVSRREMKMLFIEKYGMPDEYFPNEYTDGEDYIIMIYKNGKKRMQSTITITGGYQWLFLKPYSYEIHNRDKTLQSELNKVSSECVERNILDGVKKKIELVD